MLLKHKTKKRIDVSMRFFVYTFGAFSLETMIEMSAHLICSLILSATMAINSEFVGLPFPV